MKKALALLLICALMLPLMNVGAKASDLNGNQEMEIIYEYFQLVAEYTDSLQLLEYNYYDLNRDGYEELFLRCGELTQTTYYVYGFLNGQVRLLGSFDGGHRYHGDLAARGGENKLYYHFGHMRYESLTEIRLKNNKVVTVQASPEHQLGENESYGYTGCGLPVYTPDAPFHCPTLTATQKKYLQKMQEVDDGAEFSSLILADLTGGGWPDLIYERWSGYGENNLYTFYYYKSGTFINLGTLTFAGSDCAYPNHENGLVFKKPNGGILHVYIRNNQLAQKTVAGSWDANYGGNARPMVFSFYRMGFAFNPGFDYAKRLTPDAPAGLKAEITGPDSVRLSWNAVEGADRYIIYEGTGVPIGETEQTSITVRLTEDGKKSVFYVGAQREVDGYTLDSTFSAPAEVSVPSDNPSFLPGDVNNDGAVGADDARLALRRSVDLETYAEGSRVFLACDANHDGSVGADDARLILRASVDLETLA